MAPEDDVPAASLEIDTIPVYERSPQVPGSTNSDRVLIAWGRERRRIVSTADTVRIPEIVPAIMTTHVAALLCLRRNRVQRELHSRVRLDAFHIRVQFELIDVRPEATVAEIRRLRLGVKVKGCVDGVGNVERVFCVWARGEDGAMVRPATRKQRLGGRETDGGDLGAELRDRVVVVVSVAYFVDIGSP